MAYFIINIIYRELLVRRSECQEETDGNCRQVTMSLMLAERLIFLVYETGLLGFIFPVITIDLFFCPGNVIDRLQNQNCNIYFYCK